MPYVDPRMVSSPKVSITPGSVRVMHDGGEWQKGDPWTGWSVAQMEWDGSPAVGMRWNGDASGVGNPQSRGVPTWFILPDPMAQLVLERLSTPKA